MDFRLQSKRLLEIGKIYNRLTVVNLTREPEKRQQIFAICRCVCGKSKTIALNSIKSGRTKSCGCLSVEKLKARHKSLRKHGCSRSVCIDPTYTSWCAMNNRCRSTNIEHSPYYLNKHIEVCERWKISFKNFREDMGERLPGMSLDRIDNSKGYYKENCRWADIFMQSRNKTNTRLFKYGNEMLTITEISTKSKLPCTVLYDRLLRYKWSTERALNTPIRHYTRKEQKEL